jgi:hypothetical protein
MASKMNPGMMAMMKKKGAMPKMASGGMPMVMKDGKKMPAFAADGEGKMKKGGMAKKMNMGGMAYAKGGMTHEDAKMDKSMMQKAVNKHEGRLHKGAPMTKLASGGSASKRADGCATQGKTKGTMVKMNMGGKAC